MEDLAYKIISESLKDELRAIDFYLLADSTENVDQLAEAARNQNRH